MQYVESSTKSAICEDTISENFIVTALVPDFEPENNANNEVYKEDANQLIRKISCDVLYIDPPYNSRQYSDVYHLLENLATWEKPSVHGKAKKNGQSAY